MSKVSLAKYSPVSKIRHQLSERALALPKSLVLYFLIVLVFFGGFAKLDFATDTYADLMAPPDHIIGNFLAGGRLFTAGFYAIFHYLHINIHIVSFASFLLAIFSLAFSLYLLEKLTRRVFIKNQTFSFLLPLLLILNPFIIELFLFVEKGIMLFGILACVISSYYYNAYLDHHRRKDLIKVIIFNIIATFCYQGVVGLFLVLSTLITLVKSKTFTTFIKSTLLTIFLYGIGPLLNVIFIKLFSTGGRTSGAIILGESIRKIFGGAKSMLNLFNIIPSWCFWGFLAIVMIIGLIYAFRAKNLPKTALFIVESIYLIIVISLAALAPQFAQQTASIWIVPRSAYAFATIVGALTILTLHLYPTILKQTFSYFLLLVSTICLISVQFIYFNNIILDHYSIAELDRLRAEKLVQRIEQYESSNNITVTNISPATDRSMTYAYPGIFVFGDSNISAFNTSWSDVASMNYWNNRAFARIDSTPEWQNYCGSHNWNTFSDEQLKFENDILYICWY